MHPNRRWRASWSRAHSPQMHHASYPVFVHRPAVSDWASFRPRLATTPLPFSLPSALRKPGHRTRTYEVTRLARRTRFCKMMETEDEDGTHTKRDIQPGISGAGGAAIRDRQADILTRWTPQLPTDLNLADKGYHVVETRAD